MNEDRSTRYRRLQRRASLASLVWSTALLAMLVVTRMSVSLRIIAEALVSAIRLDASASLFVAAVYAWLLVGVNELGALPVAFYSGWFLERRYGLSNERLRGWALDQLKVLGITLLWTGPGAAVLYFFIRWLPDRWWLPTGLVFSGVVVGLANLAPVVLLPFFYRVKPLEHESLRARLLRLAERAGAKVLGAYELGMGAKTRKANAALAGLGSTRRILVSDTMLSDYSEDEIEVVLAHELAHHVHGDIWKGLAFETALILLSTFAAARSLRYLITPLALSGPADVAGMPVLLLVMGGISLMVLPAAHAMSRAFERSADRFALELTRNPEAFITAMRRIGAQNLAEERPSRLVTWLFYSHPPINERIARAQAFRA